MLSGTIAAHALAVLRRKDYSRRGVSIALGSAQASCALPMGALPATRPGSVCRAGMGAQEAWSSEHVHRCCHFFFFLSFFPLSFKLHCMHAWMYIDVHLCMYIYVHIFMHIYVCTFMYIYSCTYMYVH